MSYAVKEIFYTLQGEGANAGRAAIFCRFAGCNLWSGREVDRASAVCRFCDTDFVGTTGPGGGRFKTPEALASAVAAAWPAALRRPLPDERCVIRDTRCAIQDTPFGVVDAPPEVAGLAPSDPKSDRRSPYPTSRIAHRESHVAPPRPLVVCTGGEPLLQLDAPLVDALHGAGFEVAVETNGTV